MSSTEHHVATVGPAAAHRHQSALVWHGRRDVRVDRRAVPAGLPTGWVRIEVAWCGVCGSDVAEYLQGPIALGFAAGAERQVVLGHETSGVVVAAHGDQSLVGRRVVTDTLISCARCPACRRGDVNLCPELVVSGFTADGGLAQFVDVPADTCFVVPDGVGLDLAALSEPLAVAVRAADRAQLDPIGQVVIVGLGAVGLMLAALLGPARAVGVDPLSSRRQQAERIAGVQTYADVTELPPAVADTPWTGFECTGKQAALDALVHHAPANGTLMLVGAHTNSTPVDLHRFLHSELVMMATLSHSRQDTRAALNILAADPDRFAGLVTHKVRLDDALTVLRSLAEPDTPIVKALIGPAGHPWPRHAEPRRRLTETQASEEPHSEGEIS
jgi:(R,R)-butanediol dehydrogenase/meso-butanediol dehydrogenase/diacetyl reductase